MFDQDCTATRKDGLPLKRFGLPPMYGDMGDSVPMGSFEQRAYVEEERAWVEAGSAGIRAARDDGFPKPAGADYAQAVEHGITAGASATAFSPYSICSCGQIATFLYRVNK